MIRKLLLSASLIAAAWPGIANAAWQEASSAHFIVYADDKPERVRAFTERLEKFDKAVRTLRNMPDEKLSDAERVRVYMVGDLGDLQKLAGKGMSGVAGFYDARVGGPVAFVPRDAPKDSPFDLDAQSILFHEYTHHLMFLNWPNTVFPAWFVEGFAEFHATAKFLPKGGVQFGQVPGYRVWTVGDGGLLPAARLVQLDPGKLNDDQRDALYSRGWLLTHMLTFDASRKGQLNKYMTALNAGKSSDEAAKEFGDLKRLDRDMTVYINRPTITIATMGEDKLTIGPITLRQLGAGEAAVMPALLRSTRGVDKQSAQDVVKLARKLAAPFPNDAGAQNELAEAEFDAGNLVEAEAAADRAIAAEPRSIHALIYKGMARSAQLAKAGDKDPAHWRAARRWFAEANRIDPDNPRPMVLFYSNFLEAGVKPTANAEDGLIAAYNLAPFAYDLRMTAAGIFLHRGDREHARAALLTVAYSPHRAETAPLALDALTALDTGNVDGAIRILDRSPHAPDEPASKAGS